MEQLDELTINTARIVSAYVRGNTIASGDLPSLIVVVRSALQNADNPVPVVTESDALRPAVPIKKSVTPDSICCLECGVKLKMLKRHLDTEHSMTVRAYKEKWRLPEVYPIVAPSYAKTRSDLAKRAGLGTVKKRRGAAAAS